MKYAVIDLNGKQYKVVEGKEVLVDHLESDKPEVKVLVVVNGEKIEIGTPFVKDAKIAFKILANEEKGEKIYVTKYKAKSRYRKKIGFRKIHSRLLVNKIS
jgi:large subunit ribosomal protein L21